METYERHSTRKLAVTVISVLVIAGIVLFADHIKAQSRATTTSARVAMTNSTTTTPHRSTPVASSSGSSSTSSGYKDGSYTASDSYYVPDGNESIQVKLTVKNGVVTASSVQNSENDPTSAAFQEQFASAYKSYVIGQKLADLQLGVVAGASDTSQGFNQAVNQIASQAQA